MTKPENATDAQLLTRLSSGDSRALEALANRYEKGLVGIARGLLGGRQDLADDAVQETWVRVLRFGSTFSSKSSVKTWLYRIAVYQCHTMRSTMRRREDRDTGRAHQTRPPANTPDVDLVHDLTRALDSLPEAKRTVVLLCYHRGMTHEQAAQVLEIPVGT
ncbi:MAG: RNA polymerase sigma factor [Planctomycetes bacterium]|nr:RNA polymerase sigma factor [Planctomycetota bacterium]NOG54694.1 RNA polymerase sigma factor [Planctomycetota bacterium]